MTKREAKRYIATYTGEMVKRSLRHAADGPWRTRSPADQRRIRAALAELAAELLARGGAPHIYIDPDA